jgi:predicted ester cyclase
MSNPLWHIRATSCSARAALTQLMGVPGTGDTLTLRGVNIFRIEADRIVERWGRLDQLAVLQQLGLVPTV